MTRSMRRTQQSTLAAATTLSVVSVLSACSLPSVLGGNASCSDPVKVNVAVSPEMRDIVHAQAERIAGQVCAAFTVNAEESAATANRTPGKDAPDLWIPDSPLWSLTANQKTTDAYEVEDKPVATSPLVLGVPKSLVDSKKIPTGSVPSAEILSKAAPAFMMAKRDISSPTMMTLLNTWQNAGGRRPDELRAAKVMLPVAASTATDDALYSRAMPGGSGAPVVFPASEVGIAAFNKAHTDTPISALAAKEGVSSLSYLPARASASDERAKKASEELIKALHSEDSVKALKDGGFRVDGQTSVTVPEMPAEVKVTMDAPTANQLRQFGALMQKLSQRVRMLVAIDSSGSMMSPSGYGNSRIELTINALKDALTYIPPNTDVTLWQFANNAKFGAHDWRQLMPSTQVTAADGSLLPGALKMKQSFNSLIDSVGGGTGLYDTIWDAYTTARGTASLDTNTIVVLLTDGRNEDDPNSIGLDNLLSKLKSSRSELQPVKLVLAGLGPQSDMDALRKIAQAANGSATLVDDKTTFLDVIVGSLV
ncbi:hypothetical protein KEM60_01629 [Austwickia sp. TVS 96-490-7B]|uniref:substrate-binding domain-containing protein n=1 Tax=Austwickia sp. TVS 96-490-7B TaxID=2830843 RepID=UPI001C59F06D|nr:substrate-binding domain-containing protein [Austwickia sp. TVS 96-490-7B]MBW3085429.1 hypothetical protein [Austwickia sp. TVS 96-490-7B]